MSKSGLEKAIEIAKKAHDDQTRISGEPYINHPLRVVQTLKDAGLENHEEILICGLLHDISEDCDITNSEIVKHFGERVGFIVNTLTKTQKPSMDDKKFVEEYEYENRGENLKEYYEYRLLVHASMIYHSSIADPYCLFIKMSDQSDNLGSYSVFPLEKQKRKIVELEKYFIPAYNKFIERHGWILSEDDKEVFEYLENKFLTELQNNKDRIEKLQTRS